jgi:hypothetical protein
MSEPAIAASAETRPGQDSPLSDAVVQSCTVFNGLCETCTNEGRAFLADWARDGVEALRGVQAAQSPLDILAVQQKWLLARGCAWFDAGTRMLAGASLLAEDSVAGLNAFHLPE